MKTLISLTAALMMCGCANTSSIIEALGKDTNSVRVVVTTIYGNITVERNLPYYKMVAVP